MTVRNKGLSDQQTLDRDDENRLSQLQDSNGARLEQDWYGAAGMRVKKTHGNTTTYTFFAHYEEAVANGVTTAISHYSFGGLRIAVKRGSTLYHLHGDHLGSTSLTTRGSSETASRADYAYGAERSASGGFKTDRTFTGQKPDASGLLYDNARYDDPALSAFISPSTMSTGALANGSTAHAERTHPARALSLPKPLQALLQGFSGFTPRLAARGGPSAALSVAGGQSMNAATLLRQPLRGSPRRLLAPIDLHHPRRFPAAMRRAMSTRPEWPEKPDPSPAAAAGVR